jgi:hypothetical protein
VFALRRAPSSDTKPPTVATEKTTKRRQKSTRTGGGGGDGGEQSALRLRTDPRRERRYEPKASPLAVISVVAMSVGAVLVGAGVYGQWMRAWFRAEAEGPHPYAVYLLLGGAALLVAVALFGQRAAKPIRVGDAGVAVEKDPGEIERIEWRDVTRLLLSDSALTVQTAGTSIGIPLDVHGPAAARALAEAKERIPKKVEGVEARGLPEVDDAAGEVLPLEPPQVAGTRCKASDKMIAFEKDARLCGRCGEVYHKDTVPPRCLSCDALLK